MSSKFNRGLSAGFIEKLRANTACGWWCDVLADPGLFIGTRGGYLDVYWRGQRLFHVAETPPGLNVATHAKYLVDPALADQISLADGKFDIAKLREIGFHSEYNGTSTLSAMKATAGSFAGLEKTGCHQIIVANSAVIDSRDRLTWRWGSC